jgi:hypothetical protein
MDTVAAEFYKRSVDIQGRCTFSVPMYMSVVWPGLSVFLLDNWTAGINIRRDMTCTDDRILVILLYLGFR